MSSATVYGRFWDTFGQIRSSGGYDRRSGGFEASSEDSKSGVLYSTVPKRKSESRIVVPAGHQQLVQMTMCSIRNLSTFSCHDDD